MRVAVLFLQLSLSSSPCTTHQSTELGYNAVRGTSTTTCGLPGTAVASSFFASSPTTEALGLDYPPKRLASQEQMDLHGQM